MSLLTMVASSIPVLSSTHLKSSGLTTSPIEICPQSRSTNLGFATFGIGGLSIRLWIAECGNEGCRRERGELGVRRLSLKLCRWLWFDETCERRAGGFLCVEDERESVLDCGDAIPHSWLLSLVVVVLSVSATRASSDCC